MEFLRPRGCIKETCENVQAAKVSTLYGLCEPAVFNSKILCEVLASFLPQGTDSYFFIYSDYLFWFDVNFRSKIISFV